MHLYIQKFHYSISLELHLDPHKNGFYLVLWRFSFWISKYAKELWPNALVMIWENRSNESYAIYHLRGIRANTMSKDQWCNKIYKWLDVFNTQRRESWSRPTQTKLIRINILQKSLINQFFPAFAVFPHLMSTCAHVFITNRPTQKTY